MGQLEPGTGENFLEIGRLLVEALGNLAVVRVHLHRHVGVGHDRVAAHRGILGIDRLVFLLDVHRLPLPGAGRALPEFPVVVEQQVEVTALAGIPFHRVGRPGAFDATGHCIAADAAGRMVVPAQALFLDVRPFRSGAQMGGAAIAMRLANRVATGSERNRLFVVHRHAGEGDAHVAGGLERVGLAIDAFGIHVDQAHHHGGERVFQVAFTGIAASRTAAGGEPFLFRAPVGVLLGMPDVFATESEAEGLQAHRFIGQGAGEENQVGPRNPVAVLLLDRPEQATRLVEVGVVGPRVQGREADVAGVAAAAAVGRAVGTGGMPRQPDHQTAVMAPIGRPPILTVGHQRLDVPLQRRDVELPELLAIVEARTQRGGLRVVLVEDVEIEGLGPPVHVGHIDRGCTTVHDGTFVFITHDVFSPYWD